MAHALKHSRGRDMQISEVKVSPVSRGISRATQTNHVSNTQREKKLVIKMKVFLHSSSLYMKSSNRPHNDKAISPTVIAINNHGIYYHILYNLISLIVAYLQYLKHCWKDGYTEIMGNNTIQDILQNCEDSSAQKFFIML